MRYYIEHLPMTIPMGVQSENNAEAVEFDVSDWLARDGSLSFSVWVTRPGETEAYQADNATLKDGILCWWPTSADTAIAGEGRVEILAVSANRRKLSGWTATSLRETTTETTTEAPVNQRPWLDQALLASEEAKAAATSAAASADKAEGVVKKEIAALTEEMAGLTPVIGGQNIYDPTSDGVITGKFLTGQGREVELATGAISYFVPVEYGKSYSLLSGYMFMGEDCVYIHLYDENFNLLTNGDDKTCVATLSDKTATGTKTFKVNIKNAKYTRFSYEAITASSQFFNVLTLGLTDDVEVFTPNNVLKLGDALVDCNIACDNYDPIGIPTFDTGYFSYNSNELKNVYSHKKFDVVPGETYKVSGYSMLNVMPVVLTDGEKVVDYFPKAETEQPTFGSFVFEIPENATAMYVNRIVMGDTLREYYVSVYKKKGVAPKHHEHKKLAIIGDSLSQPYYGVPLPYHRLLEAHDNFTVENFCRSGHGYFMDEDADYAFWRQAGRVTDDTDVCLIFGSFNDLTYYEYMGNISDTGTETICGCANTTFDTLYTNHVGLKVGVILPTPWGACRPGVSKSDDYVEKIKTICENRGIPYLDLYHESGMRPWESAFNDLYYYNSDYTHPNSNGHKEYIYPHVREFVKRLTT